MRDATQHKTLTYGKQHCGMLQVSFSVNPHLLLHDLPHTSHYVRVTVSSVTSVYTLMHLENILTTE
ncbi:hypothetical protein B7P43_G00072 [Cryptotermes secundus]|uniref:Uncharacterized protein n=1 Tax=Cryptotermes secundus TaxID=105785 RepID=A0A2J7NKD9_9NEOP|nr:hypothetical protein B7P43_G00072 [Cryptotermes secundus]